MEKMRFLVPPGSACRRSFAGFSTVLLDLKSLVEQVGTVQDYLCEHKNGCLTEKSSPWSNSKFILPLTGNPLNNFCSTSRPKWSYGYVIVRSERKCMAYLSGYADI